MSIRLVGTIQMLFALDFIFIFLLWFLKTKKLLLMDVLFFLFHKNL